MPANSPHVPAAFYLRTSVAGTGACKLTPCACRLLFTHICCRHRCLQTQPMCLHHTIYADLLQARVPADSTRVPAAYYLRTSAAGIDACRLSACACSLLFTHICCRHRCWQTQPLCLHHTIYAHLLRARMPASRKHVPARCYLRTSVAGTRPCKLKPCAWLICLMHR